MIAATNALKTVWGVDPVFMRSGGSIPVVASFKSELGLDSILMGFGLADDRAHSPTRSSPLPRSTKESRPPRSSCSNSQNSRRSSSRLAAGPRQGVGSGAPFF